MQPPVAPETGVQRIYTGQGVKPEGVLLSAYRGALTTGILTGFVQRRYFVSLGFHARRKVHLEVKLTPDLGRI